MTTLVRQNVYAAYLEGDATPTEALRSLCADYEELDGTYRDYERLRDQVREQISDCVEKLGGKAEIKGFGILAITAPVVVAGYDKAMLNALIEEMREWGLNDVADKIAACQTKTARVGGLRIEREKSAPH